MSKLATSFPVQPEVKLWSKKEFQKMLSDVRLQGLTVTKLDAGYTIHAENKAKTKSKLLLKAMIGTKGYLARQVPQLFT